MNILWTKLLLGVTQICHFCNLWRLLRSFGCIGQKFTVAAELKCLSLIFMNLTWTIRLGCIEQSLDSSTEAHTVAQMQKKKWLASTPHSTIRESSWRYFIFLMLVDDTFWNFWSKFYTFTSCWSLFFNRNFYKK